MDYLEIIDSVSTFLERRGVEVEVYTGDKLLRDDLEWVESEIQSFLPSDFKEIYQNVGDGLLVYWEDPDSGSFSNLNIPEVEDLVKMRKWFLENVIPSEHDCVEIHDPGSQQELAQSIANRIEFWIPFFDVGNGDYKCIEMGRGEQVVLYDHSRLSDRDVWVMAPSFSAFFQGWSKVCFQDLDQLTWLPSRTELPYIEWDRVSGFATMGGTGSLNVGG